MRKTTLSLMFLIAWGSGSVVEAPSLPDWLAAAIAGPPAVARTDAPALDLLREERRSVEGHGTFRRVKRRVTRIWTSDARRYAVDGCSYSAGSDRIIAARAWEIAPDGTALELGRSQATDRELDSKYEVYSDERWIAFDLSAGALPGAVIAWEFEVEMHDFLAQCAWSFQEELPVQTARFALRLPPGWSPAFSCFHGDSIAPRVQENEWTWERYDLPSLIGEASGPPLHAIAPSLGVRWAPPASSGRPVTEFRTWTDVGRWLCTLADPQAIADESLRRQTRSLVAAAAGDQNRARRLARFVQSLPYVEISLGLDRGGGYQPRPAAQVLRQGYGDCKDKANLLRAMLREAGQDSWLVLVNSESRGRVSLSWPSPGAFDHCILAIRAPWATGSAATVPDPKMGTLLFFDPTDPFTPLGGAPAGLDGEPALLAAGDSSRLIPIPGGGPEANSWHRECEGAIEADGSLRAKVIERSLGEPATSMRAWVRDSGAERFRSAVETWVSGSVNGAQVTDLEPRDDPDSLAFWIRLAIAAPRYATRAGQSMLMVRPVLLPRRRRTELGGGPRRLPVWLEPEAWSETTRLLLPAGFKVDELPSPADIRTPFAHYEARYDVVGDTLRLRRDCVVARSQIPAERYAEVRDFFLGIATFENAMAVLEGPATGR